MSTTSRTRKPKTATADTPPAEPALPGEVEAAVEVEAPAAPVPAPAAAALEPPVAKPVEEPKGPQPRSIAEVGVSLALNNGQKSYLYDAVTGQPPRDLDSMFVHEQPHHAYVTNTVRLMERTAHGPLGTLFDRLVLPAGAQISTGHAKKLVDRLREQAAHIAHEL